MAWWQEPPFGGTLNDVGATVSTANATWFLVGGTFLAAFATFAAVVVALLAPARLADREQRRKQATALKLAELACEALGDVPMEARANKSWRASAQSLIARMDRMPSDYIDDATALSAFIWITDLLREAHSVASDFDDDPSAKNALENLDAFPALLVTAAQQLQTMRERLRPGRSISFRIVQALSASFRH